MSKDRVSVRNLLWGCPTWFLADFFCPTCPTHLSHQSVPRLFPNWVDRTELDGRDGRFIWTAWNKRTRKIEKTQVTPPHNPKVSGFKSPPRNQKRAPYGARFLYIFPHLTKRLQMYLDSYIINLSKLVFRRFR